MKSKFWGKVFAVAAATALVASVAGCANTEVSPTVQENVAPELQKFYSQTIDWSACGEFWCASVEVPLDWSNPTGETMQISINEHTSPTATGFLLVNPGGPGASGVDFVRDNYDYIGTDSLKAKYNIVGFDPRGTGASSPVKCFDAAGTDRLLYDDGNPFALESADYRAYERKEIAKFVDACKSNTGDVLGFIDTKSAARDLDVIRAALGQPKLDYLGFSYGTFLGTTYAALYPDKVGRFVLDGAIDPRVTDAQQSMNQLLGFDLALNNYLKHCLKQADCPFGGSLKSARAKVSAILKDFETSDVATASGRRLTLDGLITGVIFALYSDSYWDYLTTAFNELDNADGTTFLKMADFYNDRADDGTYSTNTLEANIAISCLDARQPADAASMNAQNKAVLAASDVFGRYWQDGGLTCENWPYPLAERPTDYSAKGSPAIMVVGTTGDPATPYQQAVDLAHEVLDQGFLVTFKGEGHTAYGRSNTCVSDAVDVWLVSGKLPAKEPKC
jgi:pimeloyl-ACP methyl ester carboxylesterase